MGGIPTYLMNPGPNIISVSIKLNPAPFGAIVQDITPGSARGLISHKQYIISLIA